MTVLDASEPLLESSRWAAGGRWAAPSSCHSRTGFDLVTCVNSLHHIESPTRALDEMARVLAPGGRIVVEDYLADADPARAGGGRRWSACATPSTAG